MDNNEFDNINEQPQGTLNGAGRSSTLNGEGQNSTLNGAEQNTVFPTGVVSASEDTQAEKHENVLFGTVGALLFGLIGGAIYFIIYQLGFIAGIAGLITVVLAIFGYKLFSGVKFSKKGVIISVIIAALMIPAAEYICLSYEIFDAYRSDYYITFFDAFRVTPMFLFDPEMELMLPVAADIVIAYILSGVAAFSYIKTALGGGKKK